jgi:hypothetical protein
LYRVLIAALETQVERFPDTMVFKTYTSIAPGRNTEITLNRQPFSLDFKAQMSSTADRDHAGIVTASPSESAISFSAIPSVSDGVETVNSDKYQLNSSPQRSQIIPKQTDRTIAKLVDYRLKERALFISSRPGVAVLARICI